MKSERVHIGDQAPDFEIAGPDGKTLRLADHRGRSVVLLFYRGHW